MNWLSSMLDRIFVVLGALIFLQMPLFMQQYQHQLTGHVAELAWQMKAMESAASKSNKSVTQFIQKFVGNEDIDIVYQGHIMEKVAKRWNHSSEALIALENASIIKRPWVFMYHLQYEILTATASSFQMGLLLSFEGIAYAIFGICFGYFFYQLVQYLFILCFPPKEEEEERFSQVLET